MQKKVRFYSVSSIANAHIGVNAQVDLAIFEGGGLIPGDSLKSEIFEK